MKIQTRLYLHPMNQTSLGMKVLREHWKKPFSERKKGRKKIHGLKWFSDEYGIFTTIENPFPSVFVPPSWFDDFKWFFFTISHKVVWDKIENNPSPGVYRFLNPEGEIVGQAVVTLEPLRISEKSDNNDLIIANISLCHPCLDSVVSHYLNIISGAYFPGDEDDDGDRGDGDNDGDNDVGSDDDTLNLFKGILESMPRGSMN